MDPKMMQKMMVEGMRTAMRMSFDTMANIQEQMEKMWKMMLEQSEEIRKEESVPWWQRQFQGLMARNLKVDKDGGSIQSITGATITSRAITDAVSQDAQRILDVINESVN